MMACDTEWRVIDKNISEAVVSESALFIVASCVLHLVLRCFFSTLFGVLDSVDLRVTTDYILIDFTVLSLPQTLGCCLSCRSKVQRTSCRWELARLG